MQNGFFDDSLNLKAIKQRIQALEHGKVGFYSIGLYPASIAYNCAMQTDGKSLLLAPRPGRELMGAFSEDEVQGMDPEHVERMQQMVVHEEEDQRVPNTLAYLVENCDLVVLSANSKHIEQDVQEACILRTELKRGHVVLACLAGSFSHDYIKNESYVLCEKQPNLAFFSGFHRHGGLRNPLDSFTANFCHPNALTALLGAHLLDKISPNIQVSPGIHNVEAQYIKAAKNISSIIAGFGHAYHRDNMGTLPTLLTLLLDQCLDQAATVSMIRRDRKRLYHGQPFSLTELGYGVQRIEAVLSRGGDTEKVRDHTFAQLTAMVADVRGSMMLPTSGRPTRNFQAGQILADMMRTHKRGPQGIEELEDWCESSGLRKGGLEGLKALRYWPQIVQKYQIQVHDASMVNLLYMLMYGKPTTKELAFSVMTKSRELSNYCQESVRPSQSRKYAEALQNLDKDEALEFVANAVIADNARKALKDDSFLEDSEQQDNNVPAYLKAMNVIENVW